MALIPVGSVISEIWRKEIRKHWCNRHTDPWARDTVKRYVSLLRLREGKRAARVIAKFEKEHERK